MNDDRKDSHTELKKSKKCIDIWIIIVPPATFKAWMYFLSYQVCAEFKWSLMLSSV